MSALILAALLAVQEPPAKTEEEVVPDEHKLAVRGCNVMGGWCAADVDVLAEYIRKRWEIAKERDKLRAGCVAKLEVTEPPKKLPPLKKDRDL